MPVNPNIKLYNHALGSSAIGWYGTAALLKAAGKDFPRSLGDVPVLLPTAHTAVRDRLDQWFEQRAIRPRGSGRVCRQRLTQNFCASGMGLFPAAEWVHDDLLGTTPCSA